jgi:hypothetical protein
VQLQHRIQYKIAGQAVLAPIDDAERVTLKGNVHPLAQQQFDQGAAPETVNM